MSSLNGQGPAYHERNWWDVFNPRSDEFHESEKIFHEDLSKSTWHWKQAVVVIASIIGGLFFIVGAFPLFCWTAKWLKTDEDAGADTVKRATEGFFPGKGEEKKEETQGSVGSRTEVILTRDGKPNHKRTRKEEGRNGFSSHLKGNLPGEGSLGEPVSHLQNSDRKDSDQSTSVPPIFEESIKDVEEVTLLWQRTTPVLPASLNEEENVLAPAAEPKTSPNLLPLGINGQLDMTKPEVEKPFLSALQFLERNPNWVKDEANATQVKTYFIQLAKTDFSSSKQCDFIIRTYQSIITQHEESFFSLVRTENSPLLASLKMDKKEVQIPLNLLASQSAVYKQALGGAFKKGNPVIDLGIQCKGNERLKEQFDQISLYFLKGEIAINGDNVLSLLDYAYQNQIPHLQEGCIRFLADSFNVNDQEGFSQVWEFSDARELTQLLTEEICKALCGDSFSGKAEWEKYYGDIGEVPPLPANIVTILALNCPIFEGKKVHETHMLVLVPENVNDAPLTVESLGELVKIPKEGSGGHKSSYRYPAIIKKAIPDACKASVKSHWVLITKDVIGGEDVKNGSRTKSYDEQEKMVKEIAHKTGNPYEVPSFRDMVACLFMQHVKKGERLFGNNYPIKTYTRCKEMDNDGLHILVGGFGRSGVRTEPLIKYVHDNYGIAASWKI